MELGNLSEIIASLTAVAALVAAILAARYAKSQMESSKAQVQQANEQLALERERDAVAKELEDRKNASRVSAWIESRDWQTLVVVQNNSDAPVYNLRAEVNCRVWDRHKKKATFPLSILEVKVLPPGRYIWVKIPEGETQVINLDNPSANRELTPFEKSSGWTTALYYDDCHHGAPVLNSPKWKINSVTFQDAVDKHWLRDESGFHSLPLNKES